MDETMIFCAVALGVLLLLLVFLAIYQQALKKNADQDKAERVRNETASDGDQPPGSTPFFVSCYRGSNARYFRVYGEPNRLLFLLAGPYFIMIDSDSVRGDTGTHWFLRSLKLLAITLASGAVAALMIVAVIARAVSRNGGQGGGPAMMGVLSLIGLFAIGVVILIPSVLWWLDRRGKELDALPLSQLRERAEVEDRSFSADRESVPELNITLLDQTENFQPTAEIGAILDFKHTKTGKWKIETLTTRDTQAAIQMAYQVWGREHVHVDQKLVDRLARAVEAGGLDS